MSKKRVPIKDIARQLWPLSRAVGGGLRAPEDVAVVGQGDLEVALSQSSSSRSLSSSPRWSRSAFSVAQRMFLILYF